MTHTNRDIPPPNPSPASRDGIESWLDVLTSMLSLPPSQRTQVRDELEDHLRSRVDDLLIMGTPEPEAIRTAIAELGETAQLARHISTANRTPKSFRRFAMNATFFVLAGSVLTASVSMMMPNAPQQQTDSIAEAKIVFATPEATEYANLLDSFTVDVRDASLANLLEQIDRNIERPLIVHWQLLADLGFDREAPVDIDSDPISAELALTILEERTERDLHDSIAVLEKHDQIEIGIRSQFDRRTREERIYDLSMFASERPAPATENTMVQIRELLQSHVSPEAWVNLGGDTASATVLNTTLVVSAPDRIHTQIDALLSKLIAQHEAQQQEAYMHSQRGMDRIRAEYTSAREKYLRDTRELAQVQSHARSIQTQLDTGAIDNKQRDELINRNHEIGLMITELTLRVHEQERRYEMLQSLVIDAERDLLFTELN